MQRESISGNSISTFEEADSCQLLLLEILSAHVQWLFERNALMQVGLLSMRYFHWSNNETALAFDRTPA